LEPITPLTDIATAEQEQLEPSVNDDKNTIKKLRKTLSMAKKNQRKAMKIIHGLLKKQQEMKAQSIMLEFDV
jgi:hypothetical protein